MALKAQYYKHTLNFRFEAGTSRGVLKKKDSYFLKLFDETHPEIFGLGEAGPLEGLSLDFGTLGWSLVCFHWIGFGVLFKKKINFSYKSSE